MIIIGLDIGLTGAMCALDTASGHRQIHDLPTRAFGKGRRLDGRSLLMLMRTAVSARDDCLVAFEDVRARAAGNGQKFGTNSMHTQGSMMMSRGVVEAAVDIAGWERLVVQPQTWKRHFGLIGKDKEAGRLLALEKFPDVADMLRRKKDHNRADSCFIAEFAATKHV